ncbi:DUF1801 domain-containing protein [Virgibacillus salexigens]|nr:DUF1801 domain-containing protein [Virgibacillus salexigens]
MMDKQRTMKEVDQLIDDLPDNIQTITITLRKMILEASPKLVEVWKWSMPNYMYNGLVCYIQTAKEHVNLGFHKGNELQDKYHLLQGTGKTMRSIKIRKLEDIQSEEFTSIIKAAITLNES